MDVGSLGNFILCLPHLTELGLSGCHLAKLPPQLGDLARLETLNLSGNGLVDEVGALQPLVELTKLRTLHLDSIPISSDHANVSTGTARA